MNLALHRRAELSAQQIARLESGLTAFYSHPPARYYQMSDKSPEHYNPRQQPFHCELLERVSPGTRVLEVGCGTAHLCPQVEARGGHYAGLDHSADLLADNRRRFPGAAFYSLQTPPAQTFDLVASLYTIEHIADPPAYLELLWRFCRPGGLIGIICPEFIASPGYAPSIFYGRTPRRFSTKLKAGDVADAVAHWLDLKWHAPRWKQRALAAPPGAFWINLKPRIFHEDGYDIDTDAVHLVQLKDLVWFFETRGAEILQTSHSVPGVDPAVSRFNCYLLVRKPVSGPHESAGHPDHI
jgi:SAM-dependent methyltransferase